ncbi:hypothetical protein [Actinomadura vinacea]|uniref:hypothetical protein n=1 Tax=Actinomadura vinacea TaxID=115336 RepID=UPI0031DF9F52
MNKNLTTLLATASLGLIAFGTAACGGDDGEKAAPPSASGTATAPASPGQAPGAPSSGAPTAPGGDTAAPGGAPPPPPPPPGLQVVMIDAKGAKYGRQLVVDTTSQAVAQTGGKAPANFCESGYQKLVKEGAKFPAGKQPYMDACQQGVRQGSTG